VRGLKDEAEMEAIADALEKTNWCRKDAAKMLGISYKALLYKMRQFNGRSCGNRTLRHHSRRKRQSVSPHFVVAF
jgi:DNA-binding NtrC family response regulator